MRLIDADKLEQKFANLEATALNYIGKLNERQDPEEHERWVMWTAILNERTAYKYELIDAPTVDAIPVKFIKGQLEHLRANRIDADPDDVDYAWDLKMKIEALSDLLGAWEDTYETD